MITPSGRPASSVTSSSWARALALAVALAGALGCSAYPTYKNPPPTSCTVADAATSPAAAYEFKTIDTFEGEMNAPFYGSGDMTPGAAITLTLGAPPIGAPCGSQTALEIHSSGFNDWGSLIGYNNFATSNADGSAYEGVSFWAHPGVSSNKAFTVIFDDPNTYNGGMPNDAGIVPPMPPTYDCTGYPTPDGGATGSHPTYDPATGMQLSSGSASVPLPANGCGNEYQAVVTVPDGWQLITVPFGDFQQLMTPNEVTSANPYLTVKGIAPGTNLITSRLLGLTARFPKAMSTDLWIDNLAFYRHKGWVPSVRDAGADAP
jgi:hypothetical protein